MKMEPKSIILGLKELRNHRLFQPVWLRQMIKFAIVGAFNTVLDIGLYYILTRFLLLYYLLAKALSFGVAVTSAFILNRKFTFRDKSPNQMKQYIRFWLVALGGVGLNLLIVYLLVEKARLFDMVAVLIAVAIVFFWNFTMSRLWVFRIQSKN